MRSRVTRHPVVPPHESCVGCFKGDTDTAVGFRGEREFAIVALEKMGLPREEAMASFLAFCELELGCDRGMVPGGVNTFVFRVCPDCAQRAGLTVGKIGGEFPVYTYREGRRRHRSRES
jgi:hypothetical protein